MGGVKMICFDLPRNTDNGMRLCKNTIEMNGKNFSFVEKEKNTFFTDFINYFNSDNITIIDKFDINNLIIAVWTYTTTFVDFSEEVYEPKLYWDFLFKSIIDKIEKYNKDNCIELFSHVIDEYQEFGNTKAEFKKTDGKIMSLKKLLNNRTYNKPTN